MFSNRNIKAGRVYWSIPDFYLVFWLLFFSFLSLEGKGSHSSGPGMPPYCIDKKEWLHSPFWYTTGFCLPGLEAACRQKSFKRAGLGGFCLLIDDDGSSTLFQTLDAKVPVSQ